jgi:2'-5' RNA ligase
MYYALVHYLQSYPDSINPYRQRHDPRYQVTAPHITFIFPVESWIGEQALTQHIPAVLRNWSSINVTLEGISQSHDNLVYLNVTNGNQDLIRLHDQLYTGMLVSYLRQDITYIPHVTLGTLNNINGLTAMSEAQELNLKFDIVIDKVTLIKCTNHDAPPIWKKDFELGAA